MHDTEKLGHVRAALARSYSIGDGGGIQTIGVPLVVKRGDASVVPGPSQCFVLHLQRFNGYLTGAKAYQ